jgi:transcriptional regulator with XRE-family HTH domain
MISGPQLRAAREARGLTQADVAMATGIAVPNLSRIESGDVDPRLGTVKRILDALGLELQLALKSEALTLDAVVAGAERGRARLLAAGLGESAPRKRVALKRARGVDVSAEEQLLRDG